MQLWLQIYFQIFLIKSLLWNERKFRNSSLSPLYHTISGATVTISGTHYKNERINRAFHSSNFRFSGFNCRTLFVHHHLAITVSNVCASFKFLERFMEIWQNLWYWRNICLKLSFASEKRRYFTFVYSNTKKDCISSFSLKRFDNMQQSALNRSTLAQIILF